LIRRPKIVSEFSAQRRSHPPNPALKKSLARIAELTGSASLGKVADIGCGKLRHYKLLRRRAEALFLVDTEAQIAAVHRDGKAQYTIPKIAAQARARGREVYAHTAKDFGMLPTTVDLVCCVAVFDVVTRQSRRAITVLAGSKLGVNGHFVVIIPRNDSTITRRCSAKNQYKDGYVFNHHGLQTFFCNFEQYRSVVKDCSKAGFELVCDLSSYRQVCLIFRKT
jgi:SAM-dependent methyltransferase